MILKTEEFRNACKLILAAIDNKEPTLLTETLELKTVSNDGGSGTLRLNVTNREYYCTVEFPMEKFEAFDAAVNSSVFLRLVSKLTTDTIELIKGTNYIEIKGNGDYKLPLIFNNDKMIELPPIEIENVTNTMTINSDTLYSIAVYNSKELQRGIGSQPVQKCYYVDNKGAITFTTGACVNSFTLPADVKMLLTDKVVKLFKLFKPNTNVDFVMGQDHPLGDDTIQTKVSFSATGIKIVAVLPDSGLITSIPVSSIRGLASKSYPYSTVVNRDEFSDAINRLILLNNSSYGFFTFTQDKIIIKDRSKENTETVTCVDKCEALNTYDNILNINSLRFMLDGSDDDYVTINFGDNKSVVFKKNNISDILPEAKIN